MKEAIDRLKLVERRYEELNCLLAQPEVMANQEQWQNLVREQAALREVVSKYGEYKKVVKDLEEAKLLLGSESNPEMAALVKEEIKALKARYDSLEEELRASLLVQDLSDKKDVIMEIRAGTGGEEAALFAADLFRMYIRHAQAKGW